MSALEEVRRMQRQGLPEGAIINSLREQGVPFKDISEALSQTKIKAAVEDPLDFPPVPQNDSAVSAGLPPPYPAEDYSSEAMPGMQQSLMQEPMQPQPGMDAQPQDYGQPPYQPPSFQQPQAPYSQEQYPIDSFSQGYEYPAQQGDYDQYSYQPSAGVSTDTITEISEQVVSEKMKDLRKSLEKVIDFKTTIDAKTENIEERLKRIEKIIDTLQSAVLRKVGDYVTNVEDIKKELIATQNSFAKLAHARPKKSSSKKKHPREHTKHSH